jgi:hypothetical protein
MTTKPRDEPVKPVVVEETKSTPAKAAEETKPAKTARDPGACVVDDGTPHTGRAVDGVVCSAHSNRYYSDGTRR